MLEVEAVKAAEEGRLEEAVEMLTKAIHAAPAYPSPYNNRAQVMYDATELNCRPIQ